jgi:agmatine deiminase
MTQPQQTVTRPTDDGFYMPAEWCRHARTWAAWPTTQSDSKDKFRALKNELTPALRAIGGYEPVTVLARPNDRAEIIEQCGRHIDVLNIPHISARLRDTGPTFLVDGKGGSAAVDWQFDRWAGQVESWDEDAVLTHTLLGETEIRRFRAPLTLEGTAFCGDGEGTLIAASSAAMRADRNQGVHKLDVFDILSRWLGVTRVIWIDDCLGDDFSRGEIRRTCAFVAPGHVLVGQMSEDPFRSTLDAIAERLATAEDAQGRRLKVDRIPIVEVDGNFATYTSFYAFNQAVLVPQYGLPSDITAAATVGAFLPGRRVIKTRATELIKSGASLSSLLQYQPARLLERHKATLLPKSAWQQPAPDYIGLLDQYIERIEKEEDD